MIKMYDCKLIVNYHYLANFLLLAFFTFSYIGFGQVLFGGDMSNLDEAALNGNVFRQVIFVLFFILSFICFVKLGEKKQLKYFTGFSIILLWCFISTTWSVEPGISFRRFILLLLTSSTLFMLICVIEREKLLSNLSYLYVVLIGTSFLAVAILQGGIHQAAEITDLALAGNWRGVFVHKNDAGAAIAGAIILFFYQFLKTNKIQWLLYIPLTFLFLFFTRSKTSLGIVIPSLAFGFVMMSLGKRQVFSTIIKMLVIFFMGFFLFFVKDFILIFSNLVENPELFTGRGAIWNILLAAIKDHWLLGLGYGGVWRVGDSMVLPIYGFGWVDWVFDLSEGHSGYLDMVASIGVVGFSIFMIILIIIPFLHIHKIQRLGNEFSFLFYSIYFFFLVHNLLETDFLLADKGRWLVFLGIYFIYKVGDSYKFSEGKLNDI